MHGPFTYRHILAIDLGKFNSVACHYDPATHTHRFASLQTIPQAIHDYLTANAGENPADTLVVIETCDVPIKRGRESFQRLPTPLNVPRNLNLPAERLST